MKTSISLALLVVIVASFVSSAESAQTKLCGMDPRLSMRDRRFIPAFHNKLRRQEQASAMMHMVWSEELARRASEQASTCEFKQSIIKDCSGRFMAQSQYLEGGGAPGVRVNWRRVFTNWWRGSRHYNHTTSTCNTGETCGQYIMMARDVHGQVGCSYMKCPLVTVGVRRPWKNVIIYVCNYRRT
ncbi:hypothetical protein LSAT2_005861 [Lamellibrachia satsuma]|nr:hypothetical protein LSAT2_005861 [Lamellibrachia satsuma]